MTTARDLIKASYRKINILGQGSSLSSEEANDGLSALNGMLASWSTQGAIIPAETKETFTLTGALSYTIGSGADFNTTEPKEIIAAYITYSGYDYPIQVIDADEYAQIADKDLQEIPTQIYYDDNYPTSRIYVWPVGYSNTSLTLFSLKPLSSFSTLDTAFALPAEYERAIIHNLAVEMAPEFEREASLSVKRIAKQSLDWVRSQNKKNNKGVVKVDSAYLSRGCFDIYSGTYR